MQPWRRRDNLIYALPFAAALSLAHWPYPPDAFLPPPRSTACTALIPLVLRSCRGLTLAWTAVRSSAAMSFMVLQQVICGAVESMRWCNGPLFYASSA